MAFPPENWWLAGFGQVESYGQEEVARSAMKPFLRQFKLAMSTITSTEPTSTALPLAYRCSRCFQTRCSTVDRAGQPEECDLCGHRNVVPEATAARISQGESFLRQAATGAVNQINLTNEPPPMTAGEIMKQCRKDAIAQHGVRGIVASKTKRFLGRLIDSFAMTSVWILGFIVAAFVTPTIAPPPLPGEEPTVLYLVVVLSGLLLLPAVFLLAQCVMTAKHGITVGKLCVNAKIVNKSGDPPGFLRGVVMRSWVNVLLCAIPFYGLVDTFWIFANGHHHCLHDLLAGTSVIDAT